MIELLLPRSASGIARAKVKTSRFLYLEECLLEDAEVMQ